MADKTLQLARVPNAFEYSSLNAPTQLRAGYDNITVSNRMPNNNVDGIDGNLWYYSNNRWLYVKVAGQWQQIIVEHDMIQYDFEVGNASSFPAGVTWDPDRQQIRLTNLNLHTNIAIITLNGAVLSDGEDYTIFHNAIGFNDLDIGDSDKITVTGQIEGDGDTDGNRGGGGGGITPGSNAISVLYPRGESGITVTGGSATSSGNSITSSVVNANSTVQVNGVNFINTIDYTVSGNTITFTGFEVQPGSGDLIIITGG